MLNVADSNYRQSVTGNADSVMLNAYAINNSNASKLRCYAGESVLTRKACLSNWRKRFKIAGFVVAKSSYDATMMGVLAGIERILLSTLRTFAARRAGQERLHQQPVTLLVTVRYVEFGLSLVLIILWSTVQVRDALPTMEKPLISVSGFFSISRNHLLAFDSSCLTHH
jgi:hypothetical protein